MPLLPRGPELRACSAGPAGRAGARRAPVPGAPCPGPGPGVPTAARPAEEPHSGPVRPPLRRAPR
eukprot:7591961-Alexandrium_andersonii.AAC.1